MSNSAKIYHVSNNVFFYSTELIEEKICYKNLESEEKGDVGKSTIDF